VKIEVYASCLRSYLADENVFCTLLEVGGRFRKVTFASDPEIQCGSKTDLLSEKRILSRFWPVNFSTKRSHMRICQGMAVVI